jgi:sugar phosphate isomerase/epimerase
MATDPRSTSRSESPRHAVALSEIDDLQWVLWSGTIGFDTPLLERLATAGACGYSFVSLGPDDVARAAHEGPSTAELRRRAEDTGVGWIVDPIMNWHPVHKPSRLSHARFGVDEVLRMTAALGAPSVSAIASSHTAVDHAEMIARFADLCDAAADVGIRVHLEFMPMSAVADLRTAWSIVEGAARPNGGLTFDTWHFFRSNADFDLLGRIPGDRIFAVQIDDAAAEVRGTLWDDTQHRLLPGDGDFDLRRAVQVLARIGGLAVLGPEVISPEMAALPSSEAARLARQRVEQLFDRR